jgi:hypothetical protein
LKVQGLVVEGLGFEGLGSPLCDKNNTQILELIIVLTLGLLKK